jgi:hypothetical protein
MQNLGARHTKLGKRLCTMHQDLTQCIVTYENIVVTVENVAPDVAAIERLDAALTSVAGQSPRGIGLMVIIRSDAKPPNEETRARIKAVIPKLNRSLRAIAHVTEGEGFLAAAKRSVLTLMISAQGHGLPLKVFRQVQEASPWLLRTMHDAAPADTSIGEFTAMISELRRSHFSALPQNTL